VLFRSIRGVTIVALLAVAGAVNNGMGRVPMMGWSTWCTGDPCFTDICTEAEIHSVVDAIQASGLQAAGWNWISFDDCWEADTRDANGNLMAEPTRFPNGMQPVVDYIHAAGMKVQIYTSLGRSTCSQSGRPNPLPGSYGHETQDAKWYASINADGMKGDWCNAGGLDIQNVTTTMANAINATGHPLWFNFHCDGEYAEWCPQDGSSSRVDHDHQDYWNRTGYGTKEIVNDAANISSLAGAQPSSLGGGYWWPDLDFLMTGGQGCPGTFNLTTHCPGQSDIEYRTEFTMWNMIRSVLLFATDPRNLTSIMTEALLNSEIIAINQASCPMPGATRVATIPCGSTENCQIWATQPYCDGNTYAALLNMGEASGSFALDFSTLPSRSTSTKAVVRDLWEHQDLGTFIGSLPSSFVNIPAHGVLALKLTV